MNYPPYQRSKRGIPKDKPPTIADDLFHWTEFVLNKTTPSLHNNKICPYAVSAWDRQKVVVIDATDNLFDTASHLKKNFYNYQGLRGFQLNYEIIILVDFNYQKYTQNYMFSRIQTMLDKNNNNVWLIPFHPDAEENSPISDYDDEDYEPLIQQDYAMLFIQSTTHLNQASEFLERKGYYKNWNQEDFNEIQKRRSYGDGYGQRKRSWRQKKG